MLRDVLDLEGNLWKGNDYQINLNTLPNTHLDERIEGFDLFRIKELSREERHFVDAWFYRCTGCEEIVASAIIVC